MLTKAKTWLGLLLFLHAVVHPILHAAPATATSRGPTTLSVPVAEKHSHTRDCELCRTANRVVPTVAFTALAVHDSSSLVVADQASGVLAVAQLKRVSRAPPVS